MEQITSPTLWLMLAVGYLFGSVPFGLILTRLAGTEDLRSIGSGNIGATNVLRTGRKGLAAATLLLDALKGTAAVYVALYFFGANEAAAAGLGAFVGHLYPVWLGFKGGKGVATYLGVILALAPVAFVVFAVCWLATAFLTRYSSLAALVGAVAAPLSVLAAGDVKLAAFLGILTLLVFWKHRPNISRLLAGTESRIGQKG